MLFTLCFVTWFQTDFLNHTVSQSTLTVFLCLTFVCHQLYGIVATLVYFYVSFEIFVVAYTLTICAIIMVSMKRIREMWHHKHIAKYCFISLVTYSVGFLFFWIPEQVICGNRLDTQHHTILTRMQFHAIFHITSCIAPYYFMIYIVMAHYIVRKRNPYIVMHTLLEVPVVHIDGKGGKKSWWWLKRHPTFVIVALVPLDL